MTRSRTIAALQLLFLAGTIGLGVLGGHQLNNPPSDVSLQLLRYAQSLAARADSALQREQTLRAEGRDEEIYQTVDEQLNAEGDWNDMQGELRRLMPPEDYERLHALAILEEPARLKDELARIHAGLASPNNAYLLLGLAGACMLATIALKPLCRFALAPQPTA